MNSESDLHVGAPLSLEPTKPAGARRNACSFNDRMQTTQLLNECFIALANQSGLVSLDVFFSFLSSSRAGLC
jgi:hypothetical protein